MSAVAECRWPGCRKQLPSIAWGCADHWSVLPSHLRDGITRALRGVESLGVLTPGFVRADLEAQRWIHKTFDEAERDHDARHYYQQTIELVRARDAARGRPCCDRPAPPASPRPSSPVQLTLLEGGKE